MKDLHKHMPESDGELEMLRFTSQVLSAAVAEIRATGGPLDALRVLRRR